MDIQIGMGKSGRRAWGFDDIAIVPSRRTELHAVSLAPVVTNIPRSRS